MGKVLLFMQYLKQLVLLKTQPHTLYHVIKESYTVHGQTKTKRHIN